MMKLLMRRGAVLSAILVTMGATAPAMAQDLGARKVRVSMVALDTPAGRDRLQERVRWAVKQACGEADLGDFAARADLKRCRAEASASANRQLQALRPGDTRVLLAGVAPRP